MNVHRELNYLYALIGVVATSIGLIYLMNTKLLSTSPVAMELVLMSVGALFLIYGIERLAEGIQSIIEDFREKKPGDL
jgi:VIT1/CCC1 family predicted Fe2+/Mn2+ transporter